MKEKDRNEWEASHSRQSSRGNGASSSSSSANYNTVTDEDRSKYASQVKQLASMGFNNAKNCIIALKKSSGNVDAAVEVLVSMPDSAEPTPASSVKSSPAKDTTTAAPKNTDVKKTIREALDFFNGMGFTDELENMKALKEGNGDVDAAVNILMAAQASKPKAAPQFAPQQQLQQQGLGSFPNQNYNQPQYATNNTYGMDLLSLNGNDAVQSQFQNQPFSNQQQFAQQQFQQQNSFSQNQFQQPQAQQQPNFNGIQPNQQQSPFGVQPVQPQSQQNQAFGFQQQQQQPTAAPFQQQQSQSPFGVQPLQPQQNFGIQQQQPSSTTSLQQQPSNLGFSTPFDSKPVQQQQWATTSPQNPIQTQSILEQPKFNPFAAVQQTANTSSIPNLMQQQNSFTNQNQAGNQIGQQNQ
ncbi:hypothetical protein HDU99_006413, partial [Rhizoclosmatium hyalinum]